MLKNIEFWLLDRLKSDSDCSIQARINLNRWSNSKPLPSFQPSISCLLLQLVADPITPFSSLHLKTITWILLYPSIGFIGVSCSILTRDPWDLVSFLPSWRIHAVTIEPNSYRGFPITAVWLRVLRLDDASTRLPQASMHMPLWPNQPLLAVSAIVSLKLALYYACWLHLCPPTTLAGIIAKIASFVRSCLCAYHLAQC